MVGIKDIARLVGTSTSTVSLVLNGRDGELHISSTTRAAVLDAAKAIGYAPNVAARRLRSHDGSSGVDLALALVMPLDNRLPYIGRHTIAIQRRLSEREMHAELLISTYPAGRLSELSTFNGVPRFNGAIILNTVPEDDAFLESVDSLSVPFVLSHRYSCHSYVNVDGRRDAEQVVQHLASLGHRQIGVLRLDTRSRAMDERYEGYRHGLQVCGLIHDPAAEAVGDLSPRGGYEAVRQLLQRARPTAIFALHDTLAIGALRGIADSGLRVPDDLSLVGYDDSEFSAFTDPPLTTVRLPVEAMVMRATDILIDLLLHRVEGPVQEMFSSSLIVRASTDAPYSHREV